MSITKILPGEVVSVTDDKSISQLILWLKAQGMEINRDYQYGGHKAGKEYFSFKDKGQALMFKLTWGGE